MGYVYEIACGLPFGPRFGRNSTIKDAGAAGPNIQEPMFSSRPRSRRGETFWQSFRGALPFRNERTHILGLVFQ